METPVIVISGDPERGREDVRSPSLKILEWFNKPIDFARMTRTLLVATSRSSRARPCVLHIDDDPDVLAVVARKLATTVDVISVDSVESALSSIARREVDLVILDIGLGKQSGRDLLPKLRDATGNVIPVIVFSSHASSVPLDVQVNLSLSKTNSSLDCLLEKVRDRLALTPAKVA